MKILSENRIKEMMNYLQKTTELTIEKHNF